MNPFSHFKKVTKTASFLIEKPHDSPPNGKAMIRIFWTFFFLQKKLFSTDFSLCALATVQNCKLREKINGRHNLDQDPYEKRYLILVLNGQVKMLVKVRDSEKEWC